MREWFDAESRRTDAIVSGSEADWQNILAIAAKVTSDDRIDDEVAVAKWIIKGQRWDFITASHEEAAKILRSSGKVAPFAATLAAKLSPTD